MSSGQPLTNPTNDADRVRFRVPSRVYGSTALTNAPPDTHEATGKVASIFYKRFKCTLYLFLTRSCPSSSAFSQTQASPTRTIAKARGCPNFPFARSAKEESSYCSFSI